MWRLKPEPRIVFNELRELILESFLGLSEGLEWESALALEQRASLYYLHGGGTMSTWALSETLN